MIESKKNMRGKKRKGKMALEKKKAESPPERSSN
jgi:hypothetical protein